MKKSISKKKLINKVAKELHKACEVDCTLKWWTIVATIAVDVIDETK